jgi:WD40 repeat protein
VAFSPDGSQLATASENLVQIWNSETGERLVPPLGHDHQVFEVAYSPDGRWLATAGGKAVQLWDPSTGRQLDPLVHQNTVVSATVTTPPPPSRHRCPELVSEIKVARPAMSLGSARQRRRIAARELA